MLFILKTVDRVRSNVRELIVRIRFLMADRTCSRYKS